MQRSIVAGVLLVAGGAGGCARPRELSAPAPAGALECAYREAQSLGYRKLAGEPQESYYRISQHRDPTPAREAGTPERPRAPDLVDQAVRPEVRTQGLDNEMILRERDGRLVIQVVTIDRGDRGQAPAQSAEAHARMFLAACSAPAGGAR